MIANHIARVLVGAVATMLVALVSVPINAAPASATPCPDVEVTFARATTEPPGIGQLGQDFI
ncbi:MAG: cutinase family protein, partial [Mycobacterium sp.]